MKKIIEKTLGLSEQHTNDRYWFSSANNETLEFTDDSKPSYTNRKAFKNISIQNPLFLSKNIEYSYTYAKRFEKKGKTGYLTLIKVDKKKNVFDATNEKDWAKLFKKKDDAVLLSEIFINAEPYFGLNTKLGSLSKIKLAPVEFTIARIYLLYKFANKLGTTKNKILQAYQKIAEDVFSNNSTDDLNAGITKFYAKLSKTKMPNLSWQLVDLIFNDALVNEKFNIAFDAKEYAFLRDAYDRGVYFASIKKDANNKYLRNKSGAYVKTTYAELNPDDNRETVNADRYVAKDKSVAFDKDKLSDGRIKYSNQIIQKQLPDSLTSQQIRLINRYLELTEYLHSAYNDGKNMQKKLDLIVKMKKNKDEKNEKQWSKYVDVIQYILYAIIASDKTFSSNIGNDEKWHGMYCPEVIGIKSEGIKSLDDTICIWNPESLTVIEAWKVEDLDKLNFKKIANKSENKKYSDADIVKIHDFISNKLKQADPKNYEKITKSVNKKIDKDAKYNKENTTYVVSYSYGNSTTIRRKEFHANDKLEAISKAKEQLKIPGTVLNIHDTTKLAYVDRLKKKNKLDNIRKDIINKKIASKSKANDIEQQNKKDEKYTQFLKNNSIQSFALAFKKPNTKLAYKTTINAKSSGLAKQLIIQYLKSSEVITQLMNIKIDEKSIQLKQLSDLALKNSILYGPNEKMQNDFKAYEYTGYYSLEDKNYWFEADLTKKTTDGKLIWHKL